jgi:MGT family glycosyltransferase
MTGPRTFLFAMWDGGGNVPPVLGLARRLVTRGHTVHILGDPTLADESHSVGARFTAWTTAPHRMTRRPEDDIIKDYEISNPMTMIRTFVESFVGKPAPEWAADTLAALGASGADMLVADMALPATLIAGEKLGIPTAAYCPNIWMLPTPGIPPFGPGFAPARGPLGRARDWLLRAVSHRAFGSAMPFVNAVRVNHGLSPLANIYEQMTRADEVYVLASPRFDFTSPAMPANVRYAGPILDDPTWCAPWRSPWEAGDERPLVLVGLSSTYQNQAALLRRIVEALTGMPVRGLVTLGPSVSPDEVAGSANVVVVPTAPHATLLKDATVLVTHCGHGTTMRGLIEGVPLVCCPMGRDHNDTAARVVHHGAGVRVSPSASAAKIRQAVELVLREPSYRHNARRLGDAIRAREGCVDVVDSLERLAHRVRPQAAGANVALTM